jgi:CRP-like cAMP-binding protein
MAPVNVSLPHTLSTDSRTELLDGAERRKLAPGEILFRAGDDASNLYILDQGTLTIETEVPGEGPRALATVSAGEIFGWSALLEPHVETATARAAEPCEVAVIEARSLLRDLESNNRLGVDLYRTLARVVASRLSATRKQIAEMLVPA